MNIAKKAAVEGRASTPIEIVADALDAMPRARKLGAEALALCKDTDRKVMSGEDFVAAVRFARKDIAKWARGMELSEEVRFFCDATDEQLIELQKARHFSKIQLIQWLGEVKLQLFEARHTSLR